MLNTDLIYISGPAQARSNTMAGSRRNINEHYDLGNELYEAFLDPSVRPSSAHFTRRDIHSQLTMNTAVSINGNKCNVFSISVYYRSSTVHFLLLFKSSERSYYHSNIWPASCFHCRFWLSQQILPATASCLDFAGFLALARL